MNFANLSTEQLLRVHEAEMSLMKRDIESHEELISALARGLALVIEKLPTPAADLGEQLRALLDERKTIRADRPDGYLR